MTRGRSTPGATAELLLVLDNFEQLRRHAGVLDRLLQACAAAEAARHLAGAAGRSPANGRCRSRACRCPDPEDDDRAEAFDAVRLFVQGGAAGRAGLRRGRRERRDRRHLPSGRGTAAGARARGGLGADAAVPGDRRRAAPRHRAAARRDARHPPRHASIEVVFEHSWRRLSDVEREALARAVGVPRRLHRRGARARSPAPRCRCSARSPTSRCCARSGDAHVRCTRWCSSSPRCRLGDGGRASLDRGRPCGAFPPLAAPARAGQRRAATARRCRRSTPTSRTAAGLAVRDRPQPGARRSQPARPTLLDYFEHRARFDEGLALWRQAIELAADARDRALHALLLSQAARIEFRLHAMPKPRRCATARAGRHAPRPAAARRATRRLAVLAGARCSRAASSRPARLYKQALALAQAGGHAARGRRDARQPRALREAAWAATTKSQRLLLRGAGRAPPHRRQRARRAVAVEPGLDVDVHERRRVRRRLHLREALQLSERHGLVEPRAFVLANLTELALKVDDWTRRARHAEAALEVAQGAGCGRSPAGWSCSWRGWPRDAASSSVARSRWPTARRPGADARVRNRSSPRRCWRWRSCSRRRDWPRRRGACWPSARRAARSASPDRDELRAEWARRASAAPADPPWPGIVLDDLLQRIVAERVLGHAPLIAALQDRP